jgi:hypothetical protein
VIFFAIKLLTSFSLPNGDGNNPQAEVKLKNKIGENFMSKQKRKIETSKAKSEVDCLVSLRVAEDGTKIFPLIEGESGDEMLEVGYNELPYIAIRHFDPESEMWFNLDAETLDELITKLLIIKLNWQATKSN